jgi:hypothetical protein
VGFCGGQKWRWGRFSPRTSVSPANLHSICFSTIIFTITRGWHIRPGVAAVPIASHTRIKKTGESIWNSPIRLVPRLPSRRVLNVPGSNLCRVACNPETLHSFPWFLEPIDDMIVPSATPQPTPFKSLLFVVYFIFAGCIYSIQHQKGGSIILGMKLSWPTLALLKRNLKIPRKTSVRIASGPAGIQTKHLLNTNLERYYNTVTWRPKAEIVKSE